MKLSLRLGRDDAELVKSALEAELIFWRSVAKEGRVEHAKEKCKTLAKLLAQVEDQLEQGDTS